MSELVKSVPTSVWAQRYIDTFNLALVAMPMYLPSRGTPRYHPLLSGAWWLSAGVLLLR